MEETKKRREYAKKGERNQKMVSFRCDNEVLDWLLSQQPSKGRYINKLIAADMRKSKKK